LAFGHPEPLPDLHPPLGTDSSPWPFVAAVSSLGSFAGSNPFIMVLFSLFLLLCMDL